MFVVSTATGSLIREPISLRMPASANGINTGHLRSAILFADS